MIRERWFGGRTATHFTFQWHLTNECPWNCAHCYDRTDRNTLEVGDAHRVVDDLKAFCRAHRVIPRVSLTGGDPLCYPHFWEIYGRLGEEGIGVSILGNPISGEWIRRLLDPCAPIYYQVSLEGAREHNDRIRGAGHFGAVEAFLRAARYEGMETHVMLTLTRENCDQVLPLAEHLRGLTSRFTFNRLAQVGRGAGLNLPSMDQFKTLLNACAQLARVNPVLGFKDNLFCLLEETGAEDFGGCTGHGCGAAFNFVALLPDGEVHACRKFPSLLGNIRSQPLTEIYHSNEARRYRAGPIECRGCRMAKVCRGCLAVTHGSGLKPLERRDPFCFRDDA